MKKLYGMGKYAAEWGLSSAEDIVKYEGGYLKGQGRYNMCALFQVLPENNHHWGSNDILDEGDGNVVAQLGWESALKAVQQQDGTFKIESATYAQSGNENDVTGIFKNKAVTHILTRAVDTCTFLWLRQGGNVVMAHFNYRQINFFKTIIEGYLDENASVDEGFISYCEDELKCDEVYNDFLGQFKNKLHVFKRRERGESVAHSSHFEAGIYIKDGGIEMFGDITDFSHEEVMSGLKVNNAQSAYYDTKQEFFDGVSAHFSDSSGTCCRI